MSSVPLPHRWVYSCIYTPSNVDTHSVILLIPFSKHVLSPTPILNQHMHGQCVYEGHTYTMLSQFFCLTHMHTHTHIHTYMHAEVACMSFTHFWKLAKRKSSVKVQTTGVCRITQTKQKAQTKLYNRQTMC